MTVVNMSNITKKQYLELIGKKFPSRTHISYTELCDINSENNISEFPNWIVGDKRFSNGSKNKTYRIPMINEITDTEIDTQISDNISPSNKNDSNFNFLGNDSLIPEVSEVFLPCENFESISKIIKSRLFNPIYLSGPSGNGKTMSFVEACARLKRECFRVNITCETDENDLIGGQSLVVTGKEGNENTISKFQYGPVIYAMKRGAILLLDELDLASTKIMCLQSMLEGKGIYIKKTNEWIIPAAGFNVLATANTKGQGNESGKFIGTAPMNEAFLERFPVTMEQHYPDEKLEYQILIGHMKYYKCVDTDFAKNLCKWAANIREVWKQQACDDVISTRRLVHIIRQFAIFNDKMMAIKLCTNRFPAETQKGWMDTFMKFDATCVKISVPAAPPEKTVEIPDNTNPFKV